MNSLINETNKADQALSVLADYLRQWREAQPGLTLEAAAERLGVSRATYWRMERADPGVRIEHWLSALQAMGTLALVLKQAEPDLFEAQASHFPGFG